MKSFGITLVVCIILYIAFYAYFGGFIKIKPEVLEKGGDVLVYEELRGDYKQTADATNRIYKDLLNNYGIETFRGIGVYYDDPKAIPVEDLRFEAGCILENPTLDQLEILKLKYKVRTLEKGEYVVVNFPFKGFISILMGIKRVYPAINKYMQENNFKNTGAIVEIYDVPNKIITYMDLVER